MLKGESWNAGDSLPLRFTEGAGITGFFLTVLMITLGLTGIVYAGLALDNPDLGDGFILLIGALVLLWGLGKPLLQPHSYAIEIFDGRVYCHCKRLLGADHTIRARLTEFKGIEQLTWKVPGADQSQTWHGVRLKHPERARLNLVLYRSTQERQVREQAEKFCKMLGLNMLRREADGTTTERKLEELDTPLHEVLQSTPEPATAISLPRGSKVRVRQTGSGWVIEMPTVVSGRPKLGFDLILVGASMCLLLPLLQMVVDMKFATTGFLVLGGFGSIPLSLGVLVQLVEKYGRERLILHTELTFESWFFQWRTGRKTIPCTAIEELTVQQTQGPGRVLVCSSDVGVFEMGMALDTLEFDWLHGRLLQHIRDMGAQGSSGQMDGAADGSS